MNLLVKSKFRLAQELKLEWTPDNGVKSGEVTGTSIRIYEAEQAKALDTLRHEFIEYLVTRDLVAPYKPLIDKLISLFEEEMYGRKERLVEGTYLSRHTSSENCHYRPFISEKLLLVCAAVNR